MSQKLEGRYHGGFLAGAALAPDRRVKLTAGVLQYAGSTDAELGVLVNRTFAANDPATVDLRTAEGTQPMIASEAITAGNKVYAAANGKVAASGTILIGDAITAASADGDGLEVLRAKESTDYSASGGTTAAAFVVDNDATTPKIELAAQTGGTGDYKQTIKPAATLTANRVCTLPPDATTTLVGTDTTQTLTNKTVRSNVAAVAAAGSVQGDAAALTEDALNSVSAADGTKGVVLPTAVAGLRVRVYNEHATNGLKVYPASSDTINGGIANAAITLSGKKVAWFEAYDATNWGCIYS